MEILKRDKGGLLGFGILGNKKTQEGQKTHLTIGYIHETMSMIGRDDVVNAQEIVEKFKNDPWIVARIEKDRWSGKDVLHVEARYPLVSFHWDDDELVSVYKLEHSTERRR